MTRLNLMFIILIFMACNPTKKQENNENVKSDPTTTISYQQCVPTLSNKVFEYSPAHDLPLNRFTIIFNCKGDSLQGTIFGPDPEEEHGLYFFKADLENIKIDQNKNIEFSYIQGNLYTEQILLENYKENFEDKKAGSANERLYYRGSISNDSLKLNCNSAYSGCYDNILTFRLKK